VSISMQKLTGVSRVGREIFRIKSYEKVYKFDADHCIKLQTGA
jgi:hypothetical protein